MEENKVRVVVSTLGSRISPTKLATLDTRLAPLSDSAFDALMQLKFKSKVTAVLLSIFLGGISAGRFYLGDTGYAVAKLICWIVALCLSWIPVLGIILLLGFSIWHIVDIFLCAKRVPEVNGQILERNLALFPRTPNGAQMV